MTRFGILVLGLFLLVLFIFTWTHDPAPFLVQAEKPEKKGEYLEMYTYLKSKYSLPDANKAFLAELQLSNRYSSEEEIQQAIDTILRTGIVPETGTTYTTKVTELIELRDRDLPSHRGYNERKNDVERLNAMMATMQQVMTSSASTEDEKVAASNDLELAGKIQQTAMGLFQREMSKLQTIQDYLTEMNDSGQTFLL